MLILIIVTFNVTILRISIAQAISNLQFLNYIFEDKYDNDNDNDNNDNNNNNNNKILFKKSQ